MYFSRAFILFLLVAPHYLWAGVTTKTHVYIVSKLDDKVLAVERETGKEIIIPVGNGPVSMSIYGDHGFVVNNDSASVSVIDLTTHTVVHSIKVGKNPEPMVINVSYGYVVNFDDGTMTVINLITFAVIGTQELGVYPGKFVVHEGYGYVAISHFNVLKVIDLKEHKVVDAIPLGMNPRDMVIHENYGYVPISSISCVAVIDLLSRKIIKSIPVGTEPLNLVIEGDHGYVLNYRSQDLSVIDLHDHTVNTYLLTRPVTDNPPLIYRDVVYVVSSTNANLTEVHLKKNLVKHDYLNAYTALMVIHEGYGYLMHVKQWSKVLHTAAIIDLKTHKVVQHIGNIDGRSIDFSDTHVYVGLKRSMRKPLALFDGPYKGLDSPFEWGSDGQTHFRLFIVAYKMNSWKSAKNHFMKALSQGNPMANALAAYAFLHGKFGVEEGEDHLFWYHEFSQHMDHDYYAKLCAGELRDLNRFWVRKKSSVKEVS